MSRQWYKSILVLIVLAAAQGAVAEETGPVDRKWGFGWDDGLTARLWLGGVWELAVSAGPDDHLQDREEFSYRTGEPPDWEERENLEYSEDRTESGFVRLQVGRLVARRGPLAAVCYTGLEYDWADGRHKSEDVYLGDPERNRVYTSDNNYSTWVLSLGLRPSFEVLGFLTIETAFGLEYRWLSYEGFDRYDYTETGVVNLDLQSSDGNRFDYTGWRGMGSLQFMVWF